MRVTTRLATLAFGSLAMTWGAVSELVEEPKPFRFDNLMVAMLEGYPNSCAEW
jgi:hypothetical protein